MTDAMLRLARAAIPSVPWQFDDMHGLTYDPRDGTQFDPANNSEQAWDVMAWLEREIGESCGLRVTDSVHAFNAYAFNVYPYDGSKTISVKHNGTPAGIRAAVVEAALRAAGGGQ